MMEETLIKALQADVPAAFLFVGDEANLLREPPIYSSHRRKPVSSALNFLDSGLRRNECARKGVTSARWKFVSE